MKVRTPKIENLKSVIYQASAFVALFAAMILPATLTVLAAPLDQGFVSVRGTDSGDCSDPGNPCRSLRYASEQVLSAGIVTVMDTGVYEPLHIKRSLVIQAAPGVMATILTVSGPAVTIEIPSSELSMRHVILRGLNFRSRGGDKGVHAIQCDQLQVENCTFYGFSQVGILYEAGSATSTNNNTLFVTNSQFFNGTLGIDAGTTSNSFFRKAVIENCQLKGAGLSIQGNTRATVSNTLSDGALGFRAFGNAGFITEMNIENCVATSGSNGVGTFGAGAVIRLSNSIVSGNSQIGIIGNVLTRGNNTVEGNTNNGSFAGTYNAK